MKKLTFMACAAMLASTVALNSCKSNDPVGSFEGNAEVVKTEFAITLPGNAVGGPHKMPGVAVQTEESEFQGISGIFLIPFAGTDSIEGNESRLGEKNIILNGTIDNTSALGTKSKAKVYTDVAIPLSTASFLFYAKSSRDNANKFSGGSLVVKDTANTKPQDFKFQLDSIINLGDFNALMTTGVGDELLDYLTSIAHADDGSSSIHKLWYQYPNVGDSATMYALFRKFASMRGLSSFEVARVLTDLYQSLLPLSTPMANAIKAAIVAGSTYVDVNTTTGVVTMKSAYAKFPQSARLPEGCITMVWDSATSGTPTYTFIPGNYTGLTHPTKFVYPAQLWYHANSTIKTSNTSMKNEYDNSKYWADILDLYTGPTAVNSLTRSVAVKDTVQYAVARFDVRVKVKEPSLADNSNLAEGVAKAVNIPAAGLKVTGILIGGQNHVNYEFLPAAAGTYTIYDSIMSSTVAEPAKDMVAKNDLSWSEYNHTLVLESAENQNVNIAVEMLNTTGADFYGYNNQLIPKGGKFYVIATLEYSTGSGKTIRTPGKVFKQDYTTTANLTLKDLKSAYNTIPDLRTPQLELGFAVDLTWQSGNTYDLEF